jgi:hypothetical protein
MAGDDVAGFDIEVQVAAMVQVAQSRAQVLAEVAQVRSGQAVPATVEEVAEGGAGEVLQDQQRWLPSPQRQVFVGADEVGMGQGQQ